jgi:hypothetical protein
MVNKESVKRLGDRHGKTVTVRVVSKPKTDYKSGNPITSIIKEYNAFHTICMSNSNTFKELVMYFNRMQTGNAAMIQQKIFLFQAVYQLEIHNLIIENGVTYKVVSIETLDGNAGSIVRAEYVSDINPK